MPSIHFLAAAPLDAWVRLLLTPGARVGWRYWPRVLVNMALSACVTVITLPERVLLAPVLWWVGRRSGWRLGDPPHVAARSNGGRAGRGALDDTGTSVDRPSPHPSPRSSEQERGEGGRPPTIVVLGYYRSGTTHLHNLLACDPSNLAPRWVQVLSPQGFVASWFVLKLFLWAVLPTKRPQDDMAFGPEWPGEDDFALCNWSMASPLAGRVVVPGAWEHFRRFHDLEGLSARERARWRRVQWAILWKVRALARRRRLVIKTPAHTARVGAILEVLGTSSTRVVSLTRQRGAVLASNERLMRAMRGHNLHDAPSDAVIRERIEREMDATEHAFERDAAGLSGDQLVRMTYDELIADPAASLKRAYAQWGLPWTPEYDTRLKAYLDSVSAYRSETQKLGGVGKVRAAPEGTPFGWMGRGVRIAVTGVLVLALWMLLAWWTGHRSAIVAMLGGIALGHAATSRRGGSVGVGIACTLASLVVSGAGMLAATWLADFGGTMATGWEVVGPAWWRRFTHESTLLWTGLGVAASFRLGSRRSGVVPGR